MNNRFQTAASALRFIFFGQILTVFSMFAPLFGFAGSLFILYGIFKARTSNKNFERAFMMMLTNILISLALPLINLIPADTLMNMREFMTILVLLVTAASSVIAFFQNYFIIKGTIDFLEELREEDIIRKGVLVWKLLIVLMVVNLVLPLLLFSGIAQNVLNAVAVFISVYNIVVVVLFLIFIYKSFNVIANADENVINI